MLLLFILLKLALVSGRVLLNDDAPIIQLKYGPVKGYSQMGSWIYLGIPFAQPPINELRWQPPLDAKPWSPNTYNATYFRSGCPQSPCSGPICPPSVILK